MIRHYYDKLEHKFAKKEAPNKRTKDFSFGSSILGISQSDEQSEIESLISFSEEKLQDRENYFRVDKIPNIKLQTADKLLLESPIETEHRGNNLIHVDLPISKKKDRLLIMLPYWNCDDSGMISFLKLFNNTLVPSVKVTLPYHSKRQPSSMDHAEGMFSANIGLTIRSVRQAVLDVRSVILWAKAEGYKKIDLLGVSMGAVIASIVGTLDDKVNSTVLCMGGSNIAKIAFEGLATRHVNKSLKNKVCPKDLEKIWSIISPLSHIKEKSLNPNLHQLFISARYDKVIPETHAMEYIQESRRVGVKTQWKRLHCGHYSLGSFPSGLLAFLHSRIFLKI